jgi:peptide/nickel transport system substrate-binding protein
MFFTFNINTAGGNNFIGSGQLDGNGIPPNFFSDAHVRKGFAYCFNYDTYNRDVLLGEGVRSIDIMLPGMIGYEDNGAFYGYDTAKCTDELKASKWTKSGDTYTPSDTGDISLWDTGFRFTAVYNTGNTGRQTAGQILQNELGAINDKFVVEVTGLPWPTFLKNQRAVNLPIFFSGWLEDIHDPHNWVVPYTVGTYGGRQALPADIKAKFQEIITRGVVETDPTKRAAIYKEFNALAYDTASVIPLFVSTTHRYQQRWVVGWYYNPIYSGTYWYPLSKK